MLRIVDSKHPVTVGYTIQDLTGSFLLQRLDDVGGGQWSVIAIKKNVQMKFARFASGRCGVPPLERVMEDSVNRMDSLPSVENDLTEAAIRGSLPPFSLDPIGSSSLQDDTFASLPTAYCGNAALLVLQQVADFSEEFFFGSRLRRSSRCGGSSGFFFGFFLTHVLHESEEFLHQKEHGESDN